MTKPPKMQYCSRCVYPGVAATLAELKRRGTLIVCRTESLAITAWHEHSRKKLSTCRKVSVRGYHRGNRVRGVVKAVHEIEQQRHHDQKNQHLEAETHALFYILVVVGTSGALTSFRARCLR